MLRLKALGNVGDFLGDQGGERLGHMSEHLRVGIDVEQGMISDQHCLHVHKT